MGGGVFWHGGGLARLGKGRGAECEGGTPLGEARGRESSAGRGGVEEGKRRRARGLAVACSPGGLDGQLKGAEGRLGRRSVVAAAAGMALKAGRGRAPWSARLSRRWRRGAP